MAVKTSDIEMYTDRGYRVLPCRGKLPALRGDWRDYASWDPDVISSWDLTAQPNIGLLVPEGVVVIDVDSPDGLHRISAKGISLAGVPIQKTGVGWHFVFRFPGNSPVNKSAFGSNVDLIGPGRYILVDPSVHPNGTAYQWISPLCIPSQLPRLSLRDLEALYGL